jgi:hypothetical protein
LFSVILHFEQIPCKLTNQGDLITNENEQSMPEQQLELFGIIQYIISARAKSPRYCCGLDGDSCFDGGGSIQSASGTSLATKEEKSGM